MRIHDGRYLYLTGCYSEDRQALDFGVCFVCHVYEHSDGSLMEGILQCPLIRQHPQRNDPVPYSSYINRRIQWIGKDGRIIWLFIKECVG